MGVALCARKGFDLPRISERRVTLVSTDRGMEWRGKATDRAVSCAIAERRVRRMAGWELRREQQECDLKLTIYIIVLLIYK